VVAAQANVQIDAGIGQKDHFRMEIRIIFHFHFNLLTKALLAPRSWMPGVRPPLPQGQHHQLHPSHLHEGGTLSIGEMLPSKAVPRVYRRREPGFSFSFSRPSTHLPRSLDMCPELRTVKKEIRRKAKKSEEKRSSKM